MADDSTGALPRFAIPFRRILRVSGLDACPQPKTDAESLQGTAPPNNRRPARAIRPGLAGAAARVPCTPSAGEMGNARHVEHRSRTTSANLRLAALALGVGVSSLPWAAASAACRAPIDPFANPFNKDSAHHRPIGGGAVFADRNHPSTVS